LDGTVNKISCVRKSLKIKGLKDCWNPAAGPQKQAKTRQNARILHYLPINPVYAVDRVQFRRHVMTLQSHATTGRKGGSFSISGADFARQRLGRPRWTGLSTNKCCQSQKQGFDRNSWAAKTPIPNLRLVPERFCQRGVAAEMFAIRR
jgi:hypothetical protein